MAKPGGSEMYPQGSAIAYSASNRVDDFALGIDRDFFRSLVSMLSTVLGSTSHSRAVPRTLLPSTRQWRIRHTVSFGRRTSAPKGFCCDSEKRLPHCWHLNR